MKSKIFLLTLVVFGITSFSSCQSQKTVSTHISFAFYNLENLFDTINDPNINDESYLPDAENPWNSERYQHKLDQMSMVMSDIDPMGFPSLFGLCEVENKTVVEQLINHNNLKKAQYQIIHKDSPDERGIDVALLYKPKDFKPVFKQFIHVTIPENPGNKTRDILYAKGITPNNDTLHVFINHWVSRYGGQEATEPSRIFIAGLIKHVTDSIMQVNPNANILISGDLNDNPTDVSVSQYMQAKEVITDPESASLYNLSLTLYKEGVGSLYYKSWDMFDQIIVSSAMLTGSGGIKVSSEKQTVIKHDYLLYQPKKGEARPSRTASGKKYFGGFSDHLPVFINLQLN